MTMSMGSIQAPVSLTFTTVSNPVPTTKKQVKSEPLPEPEPVVKKQPEKPLSKPTPNSKPVLKKPEPKPIVKKVEKKQPPKKEVVKKQEEQKEKKHDKDTPEQQYMEKSALKKSVVEGLSDEPVETSEADAIKKVRPIYPKRYQRRSIEGTVLIKLLVNEQGIVTQVDVVESSGFRQMDQAAVNAAKQWVFKPKQKGGRTVKSWLKLPVKFQVNRA